ncbi:unnamed protein product, partial [Cyprideis torosa]
MMRWRVSVGPWRGRRRDADLHVPFADYGGLFKANELESFSDENRTTQQRTATAPELLWQRQQRPLEVIAIALPTTNPPQAEFGTKGCDNCDNWFHGDCVDIQEDDAKFIKSFFCQECRWRDSSLRIQYLDEEDLKKEKKKKHEKKKTGDCGKCKNCTRSDDCGECDACCRRDGSTCRKRKCIEVKKKSSAKIPDDDESRGTSSPSKKKKKKKIPVELRDTEYVPSTSSKPSSAIPVSCRLSDDSSSTSDGEHGTSLPSAISVGGNSPTVSTPPSQMKKSKQSTTKKAVVSPSKPNRSKAGPSSAAAAGSKRKGVRRLSDSGSSAEESHRNTSRQCYGPGCTRAARSTSKYCSDECGLKLATNRIFQILPQRIQEWNLSPCVADEFSKKQIEEIRQKQLKAQRAIQQLDRRYEKVEALIERVHRLEPKDDDEEEMPGDEAHVFCVTCGHEVSFKNAIKHMDRCFNKYESQTSFGSSVKTAGTLFCDHRNKQMNTYCKRLRSMCSEHYKEPKGTGDEVCGCPKVLHGALKDQYIEVGVEIAWHPLKGVPVPSPAICHFFFQGTEFCRLRKKNCRRHHNWERTLKAEIELEKVKNGIQLDELLHEERQVRAAMSSRAGVLPLLLHSTYDHDLGAQRERRQQLRKEAARNIES